MLLNLIQNPIQEILVIVVMGSQPISPRRAAIGAFLLTPRKLLHIYLYCSNPRDLWMIPGARCILTLRWLTKPLCMIVEPAYIHMYCICCICLHTYVHMLTYVLCMHTYTLPYLCVVCVGQVSCDHSGSKSPVREVHHLGLSKDRKSTKNVVARSWSIDADAQVLPNIAK